MEPDKLTDLEDKAWMREALKLADLAAAEGEVPVGAVIVKDGVLISAGRNRRELGKNALYHAELEAIDGACKALGGWRLWQCDLYVTLEPCPMCSGAIVQARIPRVVIGCMNAKAGCAGSVLDMMHEPGFNHQVDTRPGVLGEQCSGMMKEFFRKIREGR